MFSKIKKALGLIAILAMPVMHGTISLAGTFLVEDESEPELIPGVFNLYPEPNYRPAKCDVSKELTLGISPKIGAFATTKNVVKGSCLLLVKPETKTFKLKVAKISCGSYRYTGSFRTKGGDSVKVDITDHRPRLCKDLPPAKVIYRETLAGETKPYKVLYSTPKQDVVISRGVVMHNVDVVVRPIRTAGGPAVTILRDGLEISGDVMIGSNRCHALSNNGAYLVQNPQNGVLEISAFTSTLVTDRMCTMEYDPVMTRVTIVVDPTEFEDVIIKNVDAKGNDITAFDLIKESK